MAEIDIGGKRIQVDLPSFKLRYAATALVIVLLAAGALTSIYSVQADEEGIVMRFGKYVKTEPPGLHMKMPFFIDRVERVQVRRQMKQEFGFGTSGNSNQLQWTDEQDEEKRMVTGDLNAALVEWVVQYRINKPREYLFNVRNADETLRAVSESVMRAVVGDRTVDEVITIGRQEIEAESLQKLQELVNKYEMGISIDQVQLKDVNPPRPVAASFNEVNQAQQERATAINIAHGEYNKKVPKASGEAEQKISEAEGYALERVNEAQGDAGRFTALFTEYEKAPEVTRRRIYLETLQRVMPLLKNKIVIDSEAQQILPFLQLNQRGAQR